MNLEGREERQGEGVPAREAVLQKSIPAQSRQFILHISNNKG